MAARTLFVSGLPKDATVQAVRDFFAQYGTVTVRLMEARPRAAQPESLGRGGAAGPTRGGFVDFADSDRATHALLLNEQWVALRPGEGVVRVPYGTAGATRLRVNIAAPDRRRPRDADAHATGADLPPIVLPEAATFHLSPVAPSPHDPLQVLLAGLPTAELTEAVQQLRVLAESDPVLTRALLDRNPQLRRAVCLIMQHARQLPDVLPPEATSEPPAEAPRVAAPVAATAAAPTVGSSASAGAKASDDAATAGSSNGALVEALSSMTPEEIADLMSVTEAELSLKDPETAAITRMLQAELLRLAGA
jgi:hypothetical protein